MEKLISYAILEAIRRGEKLRSSGIAEVDRYIMDVAMDMLDRGEVLESSIEEIGLSQNVYDLANLKQEFMDFYRSWRYTTKGGAEITWKKFHKKYKKELSSVVPKLAPAMKQQAAWRAKAKSAGVFAPEWKMLATWLNNRCWEDDLPIIVGEDEGTESYTPEYQQYLSWCDKQRFDRRLRQSDYLLWLNMRPPFNNRDTKASRNTQLTVFALAHEVSARNNKPVVDNLKAQWAIETQ